jgi:hypothetical protein
MDLNPINSEKQGPEPRKISQIHNNRELQIPILDSEYPVPDPEVDHYF